MVGRSFNCIGVLLNMNWLLVFVPGFALCVSEFFIKMGSFPCAMCWYQRWVLLGLVLSSAGVFAQKKPLPYYIYSFIAFVGLGLSFYHLAIQQRWVSTPSFCIPQQISTFNLNALPVRAPSCRDVTLSVAGISAPALNVLMFLFLGVGSLLAGRRKWF